jgi:ribosome recycling factor
MTLNDFKQKADKALEHYNEDLKSVRTGRANPSLVENLMVDAYGSKMPLNQVASISAPEPRLLTISVWDKSVVDKVVEAIKNSELNLNPVADSTLIRLNLPMMTEERRKELVKTVKKLGEDTKIALRNIRHEFLSALKKRAEELKLPENEVKSDETKVDAEIKLYNDKVDSIAKTKEDELMTI